MTKFRYISCAALGCSLALAGCLGTRQMYDGPSRPRNAVATIQMTCGNTRILSIDDTLVNQGFSSGLSGEVQVLPGEHSVRLAHWAAPDGSPVAITPVRPGVVAITHHAVLEDGDVVVKFKAEAGHTYRPSYRQDGLAIVDVSNDNASRGGHP